MALTTPFQNKRQVSNWLFFMAFLVFCMVVVGGATRLTESGLSMVNWNPVTGAIPPITVEEWNAEFNNYKTSPEYKLKNAGMSLEEFKGIFYWEWGHRLLGRLIGVFFFIPMVWFWARRQVPDGYKPKLLILFVLGGSQGLLGWYMVMSGLVDEPAVSHYRLTAHLGLALFILAALQWTALDLRRPKAIRVSKPFKRLVHFTALVTVLQIIMGALVAGLKAGLIFNTWPLMGDSFVPYGLLAMEPMWLNFFDNAVTTQFDHRIGAYLLTALSLLVVFKAKTEGAEVQKASRYLLVSVIFQLFLGIVMLLKAVPVSWGTAHQGGGVIVLVCLVYLMHMIRKQKI